MEKEVKKDANLTQYIVSERTATLLDNFQRLHKLTTNILEVIEDMQENAIIVHKDYDGELSKIHTEYENLIFDLIQDNMHGHLITINTEKTQQI